MYFSRETENLILTFLHNNNNNKTTKQNFRDDSPMYKIFLYNLILATMTLQR